MKYTLRNGVAIPCHDLNTWAQWYESSGKDRRCDYTILRDELEEIVVSTVFLGLDHSFAGGPPLLWETCVFWEGSSEVQRRYHTMQEAKAGHWEIVDKLQSKGAVVQHENV